MLSALTFYGKTRTAEMGMHITREVSTRVIEEKGDTEVPTSEILMNGVPTGRFVSGAILEAAVQREEFYLLFMTDDTPFEEMLTIHLLDSRWNLLDSALLGSIYSSGSFSELELKEPNLVHFHFIGDIDWSIEILPSRGFRFPFIPDAPGVRRSLGFCRHFVVHGNPCRQTS